MADGNLAGYDSVEKILEVERQQLGWLRRWSALLCWR